MSPEERTLLTQFLQDLQSSRGGFKDAEAAGLIDRTIRTNPDAAYLLVQHAILSDQALHAAQAHIVDLEGRLSGSNRGQGGFLGGQGAVAPDYGAQAQRSGPWGASPQPQPQYAPPPPRPGLFGGGVAQPGGFGSFLRSAGTTAAGVAGGAFLFDSLSGMFGGHRGFGGGFGGGWGGAPAENVTINEYGDQPYGGDGGMGGGQGGDGGYDDGGGSDGGGYDDGGVN